MDGPVLGVDIGGTKIRICVLPAAGDSRQAMPDDIIAATGIDASSQDFSDLINGVINRLSHRPSAIGIAVPGLVDADRVVVSDVLPKIAGWWPAASIAATCPIAVLNDAEAALAEAAAPLPAGASAAMVMVGTGIGLALLLDGRPYRGARGWAGEFGSIPTVSDGPWITLDSLAAGGPLLDKLNIAPSDISARLGAGHLADRMTIERAGAALGFGLAVLINLLNLDRIILGGGTLRFPGYVESAILAARERTLPPLWDACVIERAQNEETLVARGAARRACGLL